MVAPVVGLLGTDYGDALPLRRSLRARLRAMQASVLARVH